MFVDIHTKKETVFDELAFGPGGDGFLADLRRISTFMAIHDPYPEDWRHISMERVLLHEIEGAVDEVHDNLRMPLDVSHWKIDRLLVGRKDMGDDGWRAVQKLRKPKVTLNARINQVGNLSVWWTPRNEERSDYLYTPYEFEKSSFERPRNELVYIQGFRRAVASLKVPSESGEVRWRKALRYHLVNKVLELVEWVEGQLSDACDVSWGWEVTLDRQPRDFTITDWRTEIHHERIAREVREREEAAKREATAALARAGQVYGLPAARIVGITGALRARGRTYSQAAEILARDYGMQIQSLDGFASVVRDLRTLLERAGIGPEKPVLRKPAERKVAIRPGPKPRHSVPQPAQGPERSQADPKRPPDYSKLKVYEALPDELDRVGAASVEEFVRQFNDELANQDLWPISQADYPSSRWKFLRLADRWERLKPDTSPAPGR